MIFTARAFVKKDHWQFFLLPGIGINRYKAKLTFGIIWLVFSLYIQFELNRDE